jgi:hypothetical protein
VPVPKDPSTCRRIFWQGPVASVGIVKVVVVLMDLANVPQDLFNVPDLLIKGRLVIGLAGFRCPAQLALAPEFI